MNKTYCFDIDGVIFESDKESGNSYYNVRPIHKNIDKINALYDDGNRIELYTARGSETGIDWRKVTKKQLEAHGVKYHGLSFGKPAADYYVDDRMIQMEDIAI